MAIELIDCREFDSRLAGYLEGSLSHTERRESSEHLMSCRSCRALLEDIKGKLLAEVSDDEAAASSGLDEILRTIPDEETRLDCARFEVLISDFLDGFVPARVYHRFGLHCDACETCSRLLTDVVYAVAACHSVHTYEEEDVPEPLLGRLAAIAVCNQDSFSRGNRSLGASSGLLSKIGRAVTRLGSLAPGSSGARAATVAGLLSASTILAFSGSFRSGSVSSVFRSAQQRAATVYKGGAELLSGREVVQARLERVENNVDQMWRSLGDERPPYNKSLNEVGGADHERTGLRYGLFSR